MAERARSGPLSRPVLSVAVLLAFAVLVSLGVWQLQRLQWKQDLLARLETARSADPVPLSTALRGDADPAPGPAPDLAYVRVRTSCDPNGPDQVSPAYGLLQGQIAWRVLSLCVGPDSTTILDRGVLERSVGQVKEPAAFRLQPPRSIVAVLTPMTEALEREVTAAGWSPFAVRTHGGPVYLAVEQETPPLAGIRPEPLPRRISNNHLGYAITWFGLAAALLGVYAAMLRRPRSAA